MNLSQIRPVDVQQQQYGDWRKTGRLNPPQSESSFDEEVYETSRIVADLSNAKAALKKRLCVLDRAIGAVKEDLETVKLKAANKNSPRRLRYNGCSESVLRKWLGKLQVQKNFCEMSYDGKLDSKSGHMLMDEYRGNLQLPYANFEDDVIDDMPF